MSEKVIKPNTDWELVERHYRAGIKTLRQIGEEYGVSHTAIGQRARKFGWVRDLSEKIQQAAKTIVTAKVVSKALSNALSTETLLSDAQTVQAYGEIVANVEMTQRGDIEMALDLSRSQMIELTALSKPEFAASLKWLGECMDDSGEDASGRMIKDKQNELYQYIISLPGRVKVSKEIAAAHGVYIPVQRKVYRMESDKDSNGAAYEEMLRAIGRG